MNAKIKKILLNCIYPVAVVAIVLLVWAVAAAAMDVSFILPKPVETFREFFAYLKSSEFWTALGLSLWRSFYAFLISFVIALVFAVLSAVSGIARRLISPFMSILRALPTIAIILTLIIWLSRSNAPVAVAIVVICPTLYSAFFAAISGVDKKLVQMSRVYRVSRKDMLCKLYLPGMAEGLFEGSASGFALNIKLVVAAEALAQTPQSIGTMMSFAKILYETQKLFALTVAAVLLSVACEQLIRLLGRAVVKWK